MMTLKIRRGSNHESSQIERIAAVIKYLHWKDVNLFSLEAIWGDGSRACLFKPSRSRWVSHFFTIASRQSCPNGITTCWEYCDMHRYLFVLLKIGPNYTYVHLSLATARHRISKYFWTWGSASRYFWSETVPINSGQNANAWRSLRVWYVSVFASWSSQHFSQRKVPSWSSIQSLPSSSSSWLFKYDMNSSTRPFWT